MDDVDPDALELFAPQGPSVLRLRLGLRPRRSCQRPRPACRSPGPSATPAENASAPTDLPAT
eukprot:1366397-Alexandrium_andersonii.AAC.1